MLAMLRDAGFARTREDPARGRHRAAASWGRDDREPVPTARRRDVDARSDRRSTCSPSYHPGGFFFERSGLGLATRRGRRPHRRRGRTRTHPAPARARWSRRSRAIDRDGDGPPPVAVGVDPVRRPAGRRTSSSPTRDRVRLDAGETWQLDVAPRGRRPRTPASASAGPAGRCPTTRSRRSSCGPTPSPTSTRRPWPEATERIRAGELRKVVLARSMLVDADRDARRQAAAVAPARRRPGLLRVRGARSRRGDAVRVLVGATPELLRPPPRPARRGDAARGLVPAVRRPGRDRASADRLFALGEGPRGARGRRPGRRTRMLAPFCEDLDHPHEPELLGTANVWHLATPFRGTLHDPSVTARSSSSPRSTRPRPSAGRRARPRARRSRSSSRSIAAGTPGPSAGWTRTATASGRSRCAAPRSPARRPGCSRAPGSSPTRTPRPSSTRPSASSGRCWTRSAGAESARQRAERRSGRTPRAGRTRPTGRRPDEARARARARRPSRRRADGVEPSSRRARRTVRHVRDRALPAARPVRISTSWSHTHRPPVTPRRPSRHGAVREHVGRERAELLANARTCASRPVRTEVPSEPRELVGVAIVARRISSRGRPHAHIVGRPCVATALPRRASTRPRRLRRPAGSRAATAGRGRRRSTRVSRRRPADRAEVEPVRRREQLLELGQLAAGGTRRSRRRRCSARRTRVEPRALQSRADVVQQREVAAQRGRRRTRAETPSAVETNPSIPLAPRFASTPRPVARAPCTRRGRAPACSSRRRASPPSGSRGREVARDPALERLLPPVDRRVDASRARRVGLAPRPEPRRLARGSEPGEQVGHEAPPARRGASSAALRCGSATRWSWSTITSRPARRTSSSPARDVGAAPNCSTTSGTCVVGEPRVREEELARAESAPGTRRFEVGLGQERPSGPAGELGQRRRRLPHRAREDHAIASWT